LGNLLNQPLPRLLFLQRVLLLIVPPSSGITISSKNKSTHWPGSRKIEVETDAPFSKVIKPSLIPNGAVISQLSKIWFLVAMLIFNHA
jgi:hypothetical protein